MDERIKELAEQAGVTFDSLGASYTYGSLLDFLERFAELVRQDEQELSKPEQAEKQQALDKKADNARELGLDYGPEPVAYIDHVSGKPKFIDGYVVQTVYDIPLYTAPPRKEWVGLTEDEGMAIANWQLSGNHPLRAVIQAIETKLKEKNNG